MLSGAMGAPQRDCECRSAARALEARLASERDELDCEGLGGADRFSRHVPVPAFERDTSSSPSRRQLTAGSRAIEIVQGSSERAVRARDRFRAETMAAISTTPGGLLRSS